MPEAATFAVEVLTSNPPPPLTPLPFPSQQVHVLKELFGCALDKESGTHGSSVAPDN
jgi:hypothetical protein